MPILSASFKGYPGDDNDKLCHTIFRDFAGKFEGAETFIDENECERDMQYNIPKSKIEACKSKLIKAGFKC